VDSIIMMQHDIPLNLNTMVVPFPTPKHRIDPFASYIDDQFGLLFLFAYMWPFSRLVRNMVEEKETRIKEGLKQMGLQVRAKCCARVHACVCMS
jgi:hypothetical protein